MAAFVGLLAAFVVTGWRAVRRTAGTVGWQRGVALGFLAYSVALVVASGTVPMTIMTSAEQKSPSDMKTRALLRSDTLPMMNLDKPYAIATPDNAIPRSVFE